MHEFHLMTQVVKAVGEKLNGTGSTRLSAVRLKVSAVSHLLAHDHATLQATFQLAARGTRAEGAELEIISIPGEAWCSTCRRTTAITVFGEPCSACGGPVIAAPEQPEVVLHELVVQG